MKVNMPKIQLKRVYKKEKVKLSARKQRSLHLILVVAVLVVCFAYDMYTNIQDGIVQDDIGSLLGRAFGIVTALLSLYYIRGDNTHMMTVMLSISVAGCMAIDSFGVNITESYLFFEMVLLDAMSMMAVLCVIFLWRGYQHNVTRLLIISLGSLAVYLIPWAILKYMMNDPVEAKMELKALTPVIVSRFIYATFLLRPEIRDISPSEELKMRLSRVETSLTMNKYNWIDRKEVDRMVGLTDEGWTFHDKGPIEKECIVHVWGQNKRDWYIVVRKWKGEDFSRAVMSPEHNTRGSWGMRFDIVSYTFSIQKETGFVRIYGHDGMFVQFYTDNPKTKKDNAVSKNLDKIIREV